MTQENVCYLADGSMPFYGANDFSSQHPSSLLLSYLYSSDTQDTNRLYSQTLENYNAKAQNWEAEFTFFIISLFYQ